MNLPNLKLKDWNFINWHVVSLVFIFTVITVLTTILVYDDVTRGNDDEPEPTPTAMPLPTPTELPITEMPTQEMIPATATRIRLELPTIAVGQVGEYIVTYYDHCCVGGPYFCGTDIYGYFDPDDPTTVATSLGGFSCGTRLLLCSEECIVVVVKDKCGGCGNRHLDLSRGAWELLGMPSSVKVSVIDKE